MLYTEKKIYPLRFLSQILPVKTEITPRIRSKVPPISRPPVRAGSWDVLRNKMDRGAGYMLCTYDTWHDVIMATIPMGDFGFGRMESQVGIWKIN